MTIEETQRNSPRTLVDCGCETTVYADGSGVEIPDRVAGYRRPSARLAEVSAMIVWIAVCLAFIAGILFARWTRP